MRVLHRASISASARSGEGTLLNVYLKVIFVCGGHHEHPKVVVVHPPVDSFLLSGLAAHPVMGPIAQWENYVWSALKSTRYEELIAKMRVAPWTVKANVGD
jgi:hypothetical protein